MIKHEFTLYNLSNVCYAHALTSTSSTRVGYKIHSTEKTGFDLK